MTPPAELSALPPMVIFHLIAAGMAVAVGPLALASRKGSTLHRGAGKVWLLLMAVTAFSALFIRESGLPDLFGFTPIHLLIISTVWGLTTGMLAARRGDIAAHRRSMRITYFSACIVAGAFTLLPGRYLGDLLWHHLLGMT